MPRRVLVVDDDAHICRLVELYLRDAGYDVAKAATGEEALQLGKTQPFDTAVVDLILPHYGGLRLCGKLKAAGARVVIMSADDSPQTRDKAAEAKADAFLGKPFTKEQLLAAIAPSS